MSNSMKCTKCGASDATLLQDDIYQCKSCGSIYESDTGLPFESTTSTTTTDTTTKPTSFEEAKLLQFLSKIFMPIFVGIVLVIVGIVASIFYKGKSNTFFTNSTKSIYANSNETNFNFTVVNTKNGPEVWTVSRRNSEGLKEVNYFLNQVNVTKNTIDKSIPIDSTITWEQSLKDSYRMGKLKQIGTICWLIYGNKLLGYNVNTLEKIADNESLRVQFPEFKNGIASVEDAYDMDGFKVITKDGYTYHFAVNNNKLFTETEYENKEKLESDFIDKTEYCFTDVERQQLYKINRRTGNIFNTKLNANMLNSVLEVGGDRYKRMYNINTVDEFTPNEVYFNAAVLYYDEKMVVIIYQKEAGESSSILLKCLDANKKEVWTKTGDGTAILKPFLKSTNSESFLHENQLVIIQPYQLAICLNIENGAISWSFNPS